MSAQPSADRWRVEEHHDATFVIVDESGNPILISGMTRTVPMITRSNPAFRDRVLADVRMAAAAPEMFDALIEARDTLREQHQNCGGGDDTIYAEPLRRVEAALAKAFPFGEEAA
jgi:hypothetical protein